MIMLPMLMTVATTPAPVLGHFSPDDVRPVTITADNAEIDGAGRFEFKPDPKEFDVVPSGQGGVSIIVRLWLSPAGVPVACDKGHSDLAGAAQIACGQLMKSARFRLDPGYALAFRRGFIDVGFSFFGEVSKGGRTSAIFATESPAYTNTVITYPQVDTAAEQMIPAEDGSLLVQVGADAYPPIAMRYGLESRSSMLLGISRDGKVRSCQPTGSTSVPRTAYLDNYSCLVTMRNGQYSFSSNAPAYQGLLYLHATLTWKLPT